MARCVDATPEDEAKHREWMATAPPAVQAVAAQFSPWELYRHGPSGRRVRVCGYMEAVDYPNHPVALIVSVSGEYNYVMMEHMIELVQPSDLTPCDLPAVGERVGVIAAGLVTTWPLPFTRNARVH